jgi:hypothetical protein
VSLDPAVCADGCGRLATHERPMGVTRDGDLTVELVCASCLGNMLRAFLEDAANQHLTYRDLWEGM